MKLLKGLTLSVLALILAVGVSYANCGMDHGSGVCPMEKKGDAAATIKEASAALKESNPELSEKLDNIASQCCTMGLHQVGEEGAA